jgi:G3E family GTPase
MGDHDERTVVDLLNEQIEFCDVIVVNKVDLVSTQERQRLMAILQTLNPRARIVSAEFGRVELDQVLGTGLFDFEQAEQAPGWLKELRGEHVPETEEYGIASFVYRARRPFHPERFKQLVDSEWPGVIRSKGMFWLASRYDYAGNWSQAGAVCRNEMAGKWWAAVPKDKWPENPQWRHNIKKYFQGEHGDRRQEIVLIGMGMDRDALTAMLDGALLTREEMRLGKIGWRQLPDPFPAWGDAR